MMKPASNLLFYSMVEDHAARSIHRLLKHRDDMVFLRWSTPFAEFRLENGDPLLPAPRPVAADEKEAFDLDAFWRAEASTKYLVLEDLHVLAHAGLDPSGFYRRLLSACNFYSMRQGICFILSCARLPRVFVHENCFLHRWKFIDCNAAPRSAASPRGGRNKLLEAVRNLFPQLEPHHLLKVKAYLGGNYRLENLQRPDLDRFVEGLLESTAQFNSDVYLQDPPSAAELDLDAASRIRERLQAVIIGQQEASQKVADAVLRSYALRTKPAGPRAVFLFVGPSGVGKTRISQEVAQLLPGYRFLQINLAEHNDRAAVNKLIGLGRGYEDSEYGGVLTEPVRLHPKHVILFDELDHAHPSVVRLFYKIFEGLIKDGRGRDVSFHDCFIIMTTNKGLTPERLPPDQQRRAIEQALVAESRDAASAGAMFTQPFLGRIDTLIQFHPLPPAAMLGIARQYYHDRVLRPLQEHYGVQVELEPRGRRPRLLQQAVLDVEALFLEIWALWAMHDREQGARRLFQLMNAYLIDPLALFCAKFRGALKRGFRILIHFDPFWPPVLDYNQTALLLIDDDPAELDRLRSILDASAVAVTRKDFDLSLRELPFSAILLDLLEHGQPAGVKVLQQIKSRGIDLPLCIYSSLPGDSPHREQLQSDLWEFGICCYIDKRERDAEVRRKVYGAVREHCLNRKYAASDRIKSVKLGLPVGLGEEQADLVMEWTIS